MTVLLFDIDNTLLDFDKAEFDALGKIFARYNITDNAENRALYSRENKALWRRHEAGEISREELLQTRFDRAFKALKVTESYNPTAVDDEYQTYLSEGHELMTHAHELMDELSKQATEMYVVSNGTSRVSRPRIFESGIAEYFREIFISEEVGHHKPSLAFFDHVFSQVEAADQKQFAIIGDSLTTDILGGKNAGIKTIWYNPKHLEVTGQAVPDLQIADLLEIPRLMEKGL
ncbi:YjjG family noncanonical pyrimidine nucleotidase [Lactococcus taiwanensis]|uniref:YjjG family noncanonical pyrimidine nucleotidase n=1 Tax=Lactococcus taiwanensis TaxID=1151742 RepID=UPI0019641058|nr:YjjG family noncanonical pyrimidine nucleotidase [Lactococcus taiwanensis]QRZ11347.1 YjjG family noncanonical pyrimidine nucleotidase [Lactococcus taiwanensis]